MVGIVIVSHSAELASSIRALARQMVSGEVPLAVAGGIDDPENPFGTDPMKVYQAIEAVYSPDGVLLMMDLGSALLSAEMALEFLTPEQQANVCLCAAPLVEGTLAAVVQASIGATLEQVFDEAVGALAMKSSQLQPQRGEPMTSSPVAPPTVDAQDLRVTIHNRMGLHARPAAELVTTASQYQAEVWVSKGDRSVNAKSVSQLMTLSVRQGDEIVITAAGAEATMALAALQALADDNFGEVEEFVETTPVPIPQPVETAEGELIGIPVSPGIAIGPLFHYQPQVPDVVARQVSDSAAEWAKLQAATKFVQKELETMQVQATRQVGAAKAAIFEAQQLLLKDPALLEAAQTLINENRLNAEAAWQQAIEATVETYRALDDDYLRGRATDVLDVGQRVLRQMLGVELPPLDFNQPSILVATELTPSDTARLDPANVLGLCTNLGGPTSHSAILARALGIPAIVGLNGEMRDVAEGQVIALDGGSGRLWLKPDAEQLVDLEQRRAAWQTEQQQAKAASQQPAITQDGQTIEIAANIGGSHDAAVALEFGAEGVGLFRTEFLFMDRDSVPTEEEQLLAYRQVAETMGQHPLIIRTLDVGGDKPLPYLDLGDEDNPFLGWRGIRFCLDHPEIFKPQLRAILRASAGHNLKLMFPMVSTVSEVRAAKTFLTEVQAELRAGNIPFDEQMGIGIMIEVPSAVAVADLLAAEVDFFSIGSNDLTQYVMAADRGNRQVANLVNALQPAVLRLIHQAVQAAHAAGIWVGLCGELGGNPLAAPILLGLGLDELSMSAPNIPTVKAAIRSLTMERAQQMAADILALDSAEAVVSYLEQ